jgi:predicted nucleotidyltransferase
MKWPGKKAVVDSLEEWASDLIKDQNDILGIGFFGSYARGDSGVGSDLDVIVILKDSDAPFEKRGLKWDLSKLPVPVDLLIYTIDEWIRLKEESSYFIKRLRREVKWIFIIDSTLNL